MDFGTNFGSHKNDLDGETVSGYSIGSNTIGTEKRETEPMSFLYLLALQDGAIMASDTRATKETNWVNIYDDRTQKIFPVIGTNIAVGIAGQLTMTSSAIPFYEVFKTLESRTRFEIACELRDKLRQYEPSGLVNIFIAQVQQPNTTCVTMLSREAIWEIGRWYISDEILRVGQSRFSGRDWAMGYARHVALPCATVEQGIPLVKQLFQEIKAVDAQLKYSGNTIGGDTQVIRLGPETAEML